MKFENLQPNTGDEMLGETKELHSIEQVDIDRLFANLVRRIKGEQKMHSGSRALESIAVHKIIDEILNQEQFDIATRVAIRRFLNARWNESQTTDAEAA